MSGVSILVPTLNEEQGITGVIKGMPKRILGLPVEVVVVDGNSKDRTRELAKKAGAKVIVQKTKGKGAAIAEALAHLKYDLVVLVDGDGTYDLNALPKLVGPIFDGKADMTVATRLEDHAPGAIPRFNVLGNLIFNKLIRFFYRQDIRDMLTGYRAIRKSTLEDLNLVSRDFGFETEITIEALRNHLKILEFPARYSNRQGKSKLNPVRDGLRIARTLLWMVRDTKPLYFFGLLSGFFFLFSLWPASLVLYEKITTGQVVHLASAVLATASFLLGALLLAFGLLADMNLRLTNRLENRLKKLKK